MPGFAAHLHNRMLYLDLPDGRRIQVEGPDGEGDGGIALSLPPLAVGERIELTIGGRAILIERKKHRKFLVNADPSVVIGRSGSLRVAGGETDQDHPTEAA